MALIAFTGSRSVGLAINAKAAEVSASGQLEVRQARDCRNGGQERDHRRRRRRSRRSRAGRRAKAPSAIRGKSARPVRGPSCWTASTTSFSTRLVEATRSLQVGPAEDPATSVSAGDRRRSRSSAFGRYIELGRQTARELLGDRRRARWRRRAFTSGRTSLPTSRPTVRWRRRKSSARCWPCCVRATSTRRSRSPTAPTTR